jgi:hypothetical protein
LERGKRIWETLIPRIWAYKKEGEDDDGVLKKCREANTKRHRSAQAE